jgi:RecA/RadA recombinase
MRLDKWFISNLDDSQRQIIVRDPNENLIVQGAAGSGKTNLAIHRAVQASAYSNSYALVVYTQALKRMVAYGMDALGLDKERIAYDWAWENRGFDLVGDVYCLKVDNLSVSSKKVFIAQNGTLREFEKVGN